MVVLNICIPHTTNETVSKRLYKNKHTISKIHANTFKYYNHKDLNLLFIYQ